MGRVFRIFRSGLRWKCCTFMWASFVRPACKGSHYIRTLSGFFSQHLFKANANRIFQVVTYFCVVSKHHKGLACSHTAYWTLIYMWSSSSQCVHQHAPSTARHNQTPVCCPRIWPTHSSDIMDNWKNYSRVSVAPSNENLPLCALLILKVVAFRFRLLHRHH